MVSLKLVVALIPILGLILWVGCRSTAPLPTPEAYSTGEGYLWVKNGPLALRIDDETYFKVFFRDDKSLFSINDASSESERTRPPQFLIIGGEPVKEFALDRDSLQTSKIKTEFGEGERLTIVGLAQTSDVQIRKVVNIEKYEDYPGVVILQATYKNLSSEQLRIDQIYDDYLRLDSSLTDPDNQPYEFWSFQGGSFEWGQDFVLPLSSVSRRENYLGMVESGEGGGIPLLYLWNQEMGIAIAHLEPGPRLWYMPVQAQASEGVSVYLLNKEPLVLPPGGSYTTLRSMICVNRGDFFGPLKLYTELMAAQGIVMSKPSEEAYEPIWCSWGYEFDFTIDEILGVPPRLEELGIHWVVIDDRWFDAYGDWGPRKDTFPQGEADMRRLVEALHDGGLYVKIWWYPLAAEEGTARWESHGYGVSQVVEEHPEWLILNKDGRAAKNNRDLGMLCPALPEVQEYIVDLTEKFISHWGFDGHKLDNIYTVPPCYNPAHNHRYPEESLEGLATIYQLIYETTKRLKAYSVTEICSCGTPPNFYLLPYIDQPVTADPTSSLQVRRRVKAFKALMGPEAAVYADHVELTDNGQDFASAVGTGSVPGTKFVWPCDEEVKRRLLWEWECLSPEREGIWERWLSIYDEKMLSKGEYLDLYDIAYDEPEGHVIAKDGTMYYAFYTEQQNQSYSGPIELRGLSDASYYLLDYVNDRELGRVKGPVAQIDVTFTGYLLIEAIPE